MSRDESLHGIPKSQQVPIHSGQSNMQQSTALPARLSRRTFLAGIGALPAMAALWPSLAAAEGLTLGKPWPFSFDWLRDSAKRLAAEPYKPPVIRFPDV